MGSSFLSLPSPGGRGSAAKPPGWGDTFASRFTPTRRATPRARAPARITAPLLLGETSLHLAGADDDEIGAADLHPLRFRARVELVVADAFAVLQPGHTTEARNVQEHATPVHLVLGVLDAEHAK